MAKNKKLKVPNKLSSELLKKRIELDISQREMATLVDVSYPVYAGIEKGTYTLSLKMLTKIANYLEIDITDALDLYNTN